MEKNYRKFENEKKICHCTLKIFSIFFSPRNVFEELFNFFLTLELFLQLFHQFSRIRVATKGWMLFEPLVIAKDPSTVLIHLDVRDKTETL